MNSSQFKKSQLKLLCSLVGVGCKPAEIKYIAQHIDDYYREWFEEKKNPATGEPKKYKDGAVKQRVIRPSLGRLKSIQSAIKRNILEPIQLPANIIHGGVKGKSNITNAKRHQGNKFQFTTDLQNFYPSITHKQVYDTFVTLGYSDHISHWLSRLLTWKGQLPQGTPASTHLANLVFLKIDYKLIEFSQVNNLTYTRYIDDLTFSSQKDFRSLLNGILQIVKEGFSINYRKTNYKGDQLITGIEVFNNYIDVPNKIKAKAAEEKLSDDTNKPYTVYLDNVRKTNKNVRGKVKSFLSR